MGKYHNEMRTVKVKKTSNPEEGYESKEQLLEDTRQHRHDVCLVLSELSLYLERIGVFHDWSKIEYFDQFAQDTLERQDTPDFKQRDWYKVHTVEERHHINARVPDKVNLFDLLEMQVDCIISGLTRAGSVDDKFMEIPDEVLKEAYWNTVEYIKDHVKLTE